MLLLFCLLDTLFDHCLINLLGLFVSIYLQEYENLHYSSIINTNSNLCISYDRLDLALRHINAFRDRAKRRDVRVAAGTGKP